MSTLETLTDERDYLLTENIKLKARLFEAISTINTLLYALVIALIIGVLLVII